MVRERVRGGEVQRMADGMHRRNNYRWLGEYICHEAGGTPLFRRIGNKRRRAYGKRLIREQQEAA